MLIQTYYLHFNRKTGGAIAADDGQNVFIPNTSQGEGGGGLVKNPELQSPVQIHEFITGTCTCKYQIRTRFNRLNEESEVLKDLITNIETTAGIEKIYT